jgi:hypothetical protein
VRSAKEFGQSIAFPPQGAYAVTGLAVDRAGNLVVAGFLNGVLEIGGVTLSSAPTHYSCCPQNDVAHSEDVFIAKLDPNGHALFAKSFGDGGTQYALSLALGSNDDIYVLGDYESTIDFGGGPLSTGAPYVPYGSKNPYNVFVVRFDANGNHVFSRSFGDSNAGARSGAIAIDPFGDVVFDGYFGGSIAFDSTMFTARGVLDPLDQNVVERGGDAFLAKLTADGHVVWSRSFGHAGSTQLPLATAIDAVGNVHIAGSFQGTLDLGGTALTSHVSCAPGDYAYDGFIAKLDRSGDLISAQALGGDGTSFVVSLAIDRSGGVVATGNFNGALDLAGDAGIVPTDAGLLDPDYDAGVACLGALYGRPWNVFVAKLNAQGDRQWAYGLGVASLVGAQTRVPLLLDGDGNIFVAGAVGGPLTLPGGDGGSITLDGGADDYVDGWFAKLDSAGRTQWVERLASPQGSCWPLALAIRPCDLTIAGTFAVALGTSSGLSIDAGWSTNSQNVPTWAMFMLEATP